MKKAWIAAAAALALGGCVYGGHQPLKVAVAGGNYYDGYYDGSYGSFRDGYWGNDGAFWYADAGQAWRRDTDNHFRRDAGGNGWIAIHGTGAQRYH